MRFVIAGTTYDARAIQSLTLKHVLAFNRESEREGYGVTWGDLEQLNGDIQAIRDEAEKRRHPGTLILLAVSIWASRIAAGEDIPFGDAIDVPLDQMEFLPDPQDAPPPQDAPGPTRARPGSGRARKKAAAKVSVSARSTSARTSKAASTEG